MANAIVSLQGVCKSYSAGVNNILTDINFQIEAGRWVSVIGESGSGKSTLLSIVGLLETYSAGTYTLCGVDVATLSNYQLAKLRNQHVGWVFQNFNLIADLTAAENVLIPLTFSAPKNDRRDHEERVHSALQRVGIAHKADCFPGQLSGGEQQRVAIARALVTEPDILVCDEPTGNLDSKTSATVMQTFAELNAEGCTLLMVTHSLQVARCADECFTMLDGRLSRHEFA